MKCSCYYEMTCILSKEHSLTNKAILFTSICFTFICLYWLAIPPEHKSFFNLSSERKEDVIRPSYSSLTFNRSGSSYAWNALSASKLKDSSNLSFDINSTDVMVFLHLQKTGGTTFGRHLIRDLDTRKCVKKPNRLKAWNCFRPNEDTEWLFSRYTTGWLCGLHAGWTSLTECVPDYFNDSDSKIKRRYIYITILREPVARYLSEWLHVSRGATWDRAYLLCNGEEYDYPFCYEGENWSGVTLDEFMDCEDNLAHNRQTRMLSNLRAINCTGEGFNDDEKDKIMLETAKKNLKDMVFFGLVERQRETQILFETAFHLYFKKKFSYNNVTHTSRLYENEAQLKRVKELNKLDIELYDFALNLFQKRLEALS